MLFGGNQNKDEILRIISTDPAAFENAIAMANVGAAFASICIFEDHVSALIMTSRAQIKAKLNANAISDADLFLERHKAVRGSTLGRLVTVMEESGVSGRDVRYLRAIVELRNDFVHRLMEQVPLPGDWPRYGFSIERFANYTRYVIRHMNFVNMHFPRIMHRHGLLTGVFGECGALLWNPDEPLFDDDPSGVS